MIFVLLVSLRNKAEIHHLPQSEAWILIRLANALNLKLMWAFQVEALVPELHKLEAREP